MARLKLTQEQITEFKQQLVSTATSLFVDTGYAGVTMRAIAKELGCSPMKAYRYFGDKDEIYAMVRTAAYQSFAESQQIAYFSRDNTLERLVQLGLAYFHYATENPDQYRLMFELSQPDPVDYPQLQEAENASMKPLHTSVAELISEGIFLDDPAAEIQTHVIWSAVHGVVSLNLAGKLSKRVDTAEVERAIMDILFSGLAASSRTV
ncbi:MAG: TetR family transcriptional regulator [Gammaproteobacteria bacterium]|jgi:AcrR family transcriptional regulator|nr:TetR family transcriptional regulator [Gammaproteobacteria bacterium]|tara:strand:- start:374 stop:994 length:621 start_codon:yes stop_codon:yes gene_type:complete